MRLFIVFFLLLFSLSIGTTKAQNQKFGFELLHHLEQVAAEDLVPLLVESTIEGLDLDNLVKELSGNIRLKVGKLYSIDIPAKNVEQFSQNSIVKQIDFSLAPAHILSDTMIINTRAKSVHQMLGPLRTKYSGKNVVLGVIDTGIEIEHPDFMDLDSNNRILYIWDQTVSYNPNRKPNQYTYGVEWDSASISNKTCTHQDNPAYYGHGSNVTAAAASSGLAAGNFVGVAPQAKIIAISTNFNSVNWLQTIAESVDYIFTKADSLGLPSVINISAGTYTGSHDGLDIAARMIDQMIKQKNGRAVVSAAGNSAQTSFHLQHLLQNDTSFSWFNQHNTLFNNQSGIYFELWSDTADFNNISFSFGADEYQNANYNLRGRTNFAKGKDRVNQIYIDSIVSINNNRLALIQTYVDSSEGRYFMQVVISPDSTQYHYRFETTGNGKLDIWSSYSLFRHSDIINSSLPSIAAYPEMYKYKRPDSLQTMVSSFTALPSVITIGNYVNRGEYLDVQNKLSKTGYTAGEISENSSLGPNRLGYLKPDISSSGDYLFAAGKLSTMRAAINSDPKKVSPDSMHYRNGGTSLASPTVAGMVALLLEQCPNLDHNTIKDEIINSARTDQFTTNIPNPKWGYGKADAFALMQRNVFNPQLKLTATPPFCVGDSISIETTENFASYHWHNGDNRAITKIAKSDTVMVWALNSTGCWSPSDTLTIDFLEEPTKPLLQQSNDTLFALGNFTDSLQWYHNHLAIPQANQNFYVANIEGIYYCEHIDTNGCSSFSDSILFQIVGLPTSSHTNEWKVYPNPNFDGKLYFEKPSNSKLILSVYNMSGQKVFEQIIQHSKTDISLPPLSKGLYLLKGQDEEGNKFSEKIHLR